MILTNDQENAINICKRNFNYRVPYTIITGYAGSGKSTLIPFIISALNLDPVSEVAYISYTGKAALVMASKGCHGAMTSHRLLYDTVPLPTGVLGISQKNILEDINLLLWMRYQCSRKRFGNCC